MSIRLNLLIFAQFCFVACYSILAQANRLTSEEFPIIPFSTISGNQETFNAVWDCGFNVAGFVNSKEYEKASRAGLKIILEDSYFYVHRNIGKEEIQSYLSDIAERKELKRAIFGFYLFDEPRRQRFEYLGEWNRVIQKEFPGVLGFVNLLPNYAKSDQLGTNTYEDYLKMYSEISAPRALIYDNYGLTQSAEMKPTFFANLDMVQQVSERNGIPFIPVILCCAMLDFPEPSISSLSLQVFSSLAYGARGIAYFSYVTPSVGNFRSGPIDQFGSKTQTWLMVQYVNRQLHALGSTLKGLKKVNTFYYDGNPRVVTTNSRFLKALNGKRLLVGEFLTLEGKSAVIIVNTDLTKSTQFSMVFTQPGIQKLVDNFSGVPRSIGPEDQWLSPGSGKILIFSAD